MLGVNALKKLTLSIYKSNSDIRDFSRQNHVLVDERTRRSAIRIAVIDDQLFLPQTNLQVYGYKITSIGDIKSLDQVADYNIILCDLMGVGMNFDTKNQGASLISEIKKNFPSKIVIAYTGASMKALVAKSAQSRADALFKKDIDNEEWIEHLDQFASEAIDPFVIWNKIRARLIELNADTKTILALEDAYVRSVLARDASFIEMNAIISNEKIGGDIRAIIQGLISSIIFTAIFGG